MFISKYLKAFVLLSLAAVLILPTYIYFFLTPKFTELTIEGTEQQARQVSNHLISMFFSGYQDLSKAPVHSTLAQQNKKIQAEFKIEKLKLFLPSGKILYSSDPKDIGKVNDKPYFTEIVAKGEMYTKVVEKEKKSLEGRTLTVDVVEIYAPIMKNDKFIGAFEIYYDISETRGRLYNLISQVYIVFIIISCILLIAIFTSYYKAQKSISERKKLDEEQKRNYDTEVVFNNLLQLSLARTSLDELFEIFIANITSFPWMEVEPTGTLFLIDDDSGVLELKTQRGLNKALLSSCAKVPLGKCICGRTAASGKCFFCDCIDEDHDIKYEGMEPHGHYSVPICSSTGDVLGVFTLYTKVGIKHNPRVEEILIAASKLVAGIIERKRLEDQLHNMSITDELTGLLNRRGFTILAQQQLDLAERHGSKMTLQFFDLDDLKKINDNLGHHVGDQAIIDTANILKETFRTSDVIARMGGDEFVTFGRSDSEIGSDTIYAKRAQENLTIFNAKTKRPYKLSFSVGEAYYTPHSQKSLDDILSQADKVMYEEKLKKKKFKKTE